MEKVELEVQGFPVLAFVEFRRGSPQDFYDPGEPDHYAVREIKSTEDAAKDMFVQAFAKDDDFRQGLANELEEILGTPIAVEL